MTLSIHINTYHDLTTDPSYHSFKTLMDISLNKSNDKLDPHPTALFDVKKEHI